MRIKVILQISWHRLTIGIPDEIVDQVARRIRDHDCALLLQRHVRGMTTRAHFKHRFAPQWLRLRTALTLVGGEEVLGTLEANARVRKEWQIEALSWVHMLEEPGSFHVLQTIVQEVLMGEWG